MKQELILFGRKIAELRTKRGLTQEKLSELANCTANHIAKIESARAKPSYELISNLANALNVEPKDLFDFEKIRTPKYYKSKLMSLIDLADEKQLPALYKLCKLFLDI